jgi:hypothetical protein
MLLCQHLLATRRPPRVGRARWPGKPTEVWRQPNPCAICWYPAPPLPPSVPTACPGRLLPLAPHRRPCASPPWPVAAAASWLACVFGAETREHPPAPPPPPIPLADSLCEASRPIGHHKLSLPGSLHSDWLRATGTRSSLMQVGSAAPGALGRGSARLRRRHAGGLHQCSARGASGRTCGIARLRGRTPFGEYMRGGK